MKIIIEQWETIKTERLHKIEINSDNYPQMKDMSEEEIKNYINENSYSMSAKQSDIYESLGDEMDDDFIEENCKAPEYDDYYITFKK